MAYGDEDRPAAEIGPVTLKYEQPNVSVDTSARFATHEVIGDTTVRQKLGEDPDEISIEGMCTKREANQIDALKLEETVQVVTGRWEGEAQVASTSTRPVADGGAVDADSEWVHRFTIELVQIGYQTSTGIGGLGAGIAGSGAAISQF